MQKFDIFDIPKCVTHGEKCYAFNVRMSGAGDEQTQMKFVEDSGGVHLRVVLNEIVFECSGSWKAHSVPPGTLARQHGIFG